jgi:hypothetical protein
MWSRDGVARARLGAAGQLRRALGSDRICVRSVACGRPWGLVATAHDGGEHRAFGVFDDAKIGAAATEEDVLKGSPGSSLSNLERFGLLPLPSKLFLAAGFVHPGEQ